MTGGAFYRKCIVACPFFEMGRLRMSRISDRFEQFVEAGMPPSITSRRAPAARKLEGARVQRREAAAIEFTKAC